MNLFTNAKLEHLSKDKIEKIQKKKTEYKLLGTFMRTKGLKLFSYNSISGEVKELKIKYSNQVTIISDGEGGLTYYDPEMQKVNIDSNNTHFEALNLISAIDRVEKSKQGLKDLCNLKKKTNNKINFF